MRQYKTIFFTKSQGFPGFRFMEMRQSFAYLGLAFITAVLLLFGGQLARDVGVTLHPTSAYASIGAAGVAPEYNASERRYILRSVAANSENLLKLNREAVEVLMSRAPDMVRADLPSIVWQYRSTDCVLDIYFRSDNRDAIGAPVVHYETRLREGHAEGDAQSCIRDFIPQSYGPRMVSVSAFYKPYLR